MLYTTCKITKAPPATVIIRQKPQHDSVSPVRASAILVATCEGWLARTRCPRRYSSVHVSFNPLRPEHPQDARLLAHKPPCQEGTAYAWINVLLIHQYKGNEHLGPSKHMVSSDTTVPVACVSLQTAIRICLELATAWSAVWTQLYIPQFYDTIVQNELYMSAPRRKRTPEYNSKHRQQRVNITDKSRTTCRRPRPKPRTGGTVIHWKVLHRPRVTREVYIRVASIGLVYFCSSPSTHVVLTAHAIPLLHAFPRHYHPGFCRGPALHFLDVFGSSLLPSRSDWSACPCFCCPNWPCEDVVDVSDDTENAPSPLHVWKASLMLVFALPWGIGKCIDESKNALARAPQ